MHSGGTDERVAAEPRQPDGRGPGGSARILPLGSRLLPPWPARPSARRAWRVPEGPARGRGSQLLRHRAARREPALGCRPASAPGLWGEGSHEAPDEAATPGAMKQEGSARRRGADKAKPPPGGGEQEPPPPPAPQDVEMKEEAVAGGGPTGEADGKAAAAAAEHSQRELDTVTLEGTREPGLGTRHDRGRQRPCGLASPGDPSCHHPGFLRINPQVPASATLTRLTPSPNNSRLRTPPPTAGYV